MKKSKGRISGKFSSRAFFLASVAALIIITAFACADWTSAAPTIEARHFVDVTARAGIRFVHYNGAFGKQYLPETMGSGCAFIDYDNDGNPDILLINGSDFPGHNSRRATMKLYHNNGNGTFTDVTARAGLAVPMYGMGVAVGDYDNDGYDDVYVTALGEAHLFHNEHNGTFKDVTQSAGVNNTGYGTSAAWVDYDKDGKLDLFVSNYVQWTLKGDIYCSLDGHHKSYCTPEAYKGESNRLFHNLGNGKFEDVTKKAGIYDLSGKNLGIAILDYNMDGWPDIAVSNDTEPNKLYKNNHDGTFTQDSVQAGIAYDSNGIARGAMGIDAADFDRSGYPSLAIGNFSNQMLGLYHNEKHDFFIDVAPQSTIGQSSRLSLTFGLFFFDYDLDGLPDLFVANGHIEPDIARIQARVTYAERPLLFRNAGQGRFDDVGKLLGFTQQMVARGAAYADINNDGAPDILVTTNNGPAYLFENTGSGANSLRIKTVGTRSNRDGLGAQIHVTAGGGTQWQTGHSGSSYCSDSEHVLTFGLGKAESAQKVEITWPSGQKDVLNNLKAGATYTIEEGGKILSINPFKK